MDQSNLLRWNRAYFPHVSLRSLIRGDALGEHLVLHVRPLHQVLDMAVQRNEFWQRTYPEEHHEEFREYVRKFRRECVSAILDGLGKLK